MKNNKKADTIAWIIIAVFILSFALLWIVNVLDYNHSISDNYEKETDFVGYSIGNFTCFMQQNGKAENIGNNSRKHTERNSGCTG